MLIIFARFFQFLVLAISFKIMTYALPADELGRVSSILSVIGLFALVLINPVGMYQARNFLMWMRAGVIKKLFKGFLAYLSLAWLVASISFYALSSSLFQPLQIYFGAITIILLGSLVFNTVLATFSTNLLLLDRKIEWSFFLILSSMLTLSSMFLAITIFSPSAEAWLIGAAASYALCGLLITVFFFQYVSDSQQQEVDVYAVFSWKALLDFCLPLSGTVSAIWIIFQSYRVSLVGTLDLETLGMFFAGYTLAAWIMNAVDLTASAYDGGRVYRESDSKARETRRNAWRRYIERLLPFYLVTASSIVLLSSELMTLFVAESYRSAQPYLIVGAFVELLRVWLDKLSFLFQLELDNSRLLPISIFGAVGAVFITFTAVPYIGMYAPVAGAFTAGLMITVVALARVVFRNQDKRVRIFQPMLRSVICVASGALSYAFADMMFSSSTVWESSIRVAFFSIGGAVAFFFLVIKVR